MNIIIDPKAQEYIKKNSSDNTITIELKIIGGSWQTFHQPSVKMGPPDSKEKYTMYEEGEIKIFVAPNVRAKKDILRIRSSKFLTKEYIYIEGMAFL